MKSGQDKWSLGALAIGGVLGIGILVIIFGGVLLSYVSQSTTQSAPIVSSSAISPTAAVSSSQSKNTVNTVEEADASTGQSIVATQAKGASTDAQTAQTQTAEPPAAATTEPTITTQAEPDAAQQNTISPEEAMDKLLTQEEQKQADEIIASLEGVDVSKMDYKVARWHPIHFKPAIYKASNETCLKCHQEIMTRETRELSPAGLKREDALAWYQTLDTYEGDQLTFHQRHLAAPFIKKVANMSCNTCHQGNDPREEVGSSAADIRGDLTMRKMVNPEVCLMCHGRHDYEIMGLPGPWLETGAAFQFNCLVCHAGIRTSRHQVNFLNAKGIEAEAQTNRDTCFGCHGGRQWYRIAYKYPRHPWPGDTGAKPDWAVDRPTMSELRFLIEAPQQ
ncbi:MAG: hypothetical protein CR991_11905 [Proteobacteria bacterium]|nr:MAG: hypothetical protein CR991_11905 [Pseudomonadota bacterium]